jgi:hypothetical protein
VFSPRLLVDLHADSPVTFAELAARVQRRNALELTPILGPVRHVGDIPQIHGDVLARHDDHVADVVDVVELSLAANEIRRVALVDLPERKVLVFGFQRLYDAIDGQVQGGESFPSTGRRESVAGDRR